MTLLDRDFAKEFFKTFLLFQVLLSLIFMVDSIIVLFQEVTKAESSILAALFLYYIKSLPAFLLDVVPFGVAISTLWVIMQKARSNELLAYLAGGISPLRLTLPLVCCAAVVSVGFFFAKESIATQLQREAKILRKVSIQQKNPDQVIEKQGIHRRASQDQFYFVERLSSLSSLMHNVSFVLLNKETALPRAMVRAGTAQLQDGSDSIWLLSNVSVRQFDQNGKVIRYDYYKQTTNKEIGLELEEKLAEFLSSIDDPGKMTYWELLTAKAIAIEQNKPTREISMKIQSKYAFAVGIIILCFLICALSLKPTSTDVVSNFGTALAVIIGYYIVSTVMQQIGLLNFGIPVVIASWLTNTLFIVYSLHLAYRTHTQA